MHATALVRSLASLSLLVLGALAALTALAGCRRAALVALPSKDAHVVADFAAKTIEHRVKIEAHLHAWRGEPRDLEDRATTVLVRLENQGDVAIEISRTAFELVTGTARFFTVAPEQITEQSAPLVEAQLPEGSVLAPGESTSGYLYFPRIEGSWGFVHLRTHLFAEPSRALLGSIDLPFGTGRVERCSLAHVDKREPDASDFLFQTCLAPF